MKDNFENALKKVLVHEGGWADHPQDPGGATMKGVTLATYRRFFGDTKTKEELKAISDDELHTIYREGYWNKCLCDELPAGIDYALFDSAVNSGPARGAKWLQAAVGATQDGGIGPKTLAAVADNESAMVVEIMCDRRLRFLRSLSTWSTFGGGWKRRVEGVRSTALDMAGGISRAEPSVAYETVRLGDQGEWVRRLQDVLGILVDGRFDSATEEALKAWQDHHGLEADGVAGRITYRAMGLIA